MVVGLIIETNLELRIIKYKQKTKIIEILFVNSFSSIVSETKGKIE